MVFRFLHYPKNTFRKINFNTPRDLIRTCRQPIKVRHWNPTPYSIRFHPPRIRKAFIVSHLTIDIFQRETERLNWGVIVRIQQLKLRSFRMEMVSGKKRQRRRFSYVAILLFVIAKVHPGGVRVYSGHEKQTRKFNIFSTDNGAGESIRLSLLGCRSCAASFF